MDVQKKEVLTTREKSYFLKRMLILYGLWMRIRESHN